MIKNLEVKFLMISNILLFYRCYIKEGISTAKPSLGSSAGQQVT
jgi:hypothetical protein